MGSGSMTPYCCGCCNINTSAAAAAGRPGAIFKGSDSDGRRGKYVCSLYVFFRFHSHRMWTETEKTPGVTVLVSADSNRCFFHQFILIICNCNNCQIETFRTTTRHKNTTINFYSSPAGLGSRIRNRIGSHRSSSSRSASGSR